MGFRHVRERILKSPVGVYDLQRLRHTMGRPRITQSVDLDPHRDGNASHTNAEPSNLKIISNLLMEDFLFLWNLIN